MPAQAHSPLRAAHSSAASAEECRLELTTDSLHDLASPINQLGSITDLLRKKGGSSFDPDTEVLFGLLETSTRRLQNLVAGLRTYAQIACSAAAPRLCDGNTLLDSGLAMIQPQITATNAVVTRGRLPELFCDSAQFSYVFASLVDNSIKFRGEQRPEIHVDSGAENNSWILTVRDNGIGIDPRHHQRIFSAFKRIHSDGYPGAGVGLTIARFVLERHGGRIWVKSELGHGATFYLALPKGAEKTAGGPASRIPSSS